MSTDLVQKIIVVVVIFCLILFSWELFHPPNTGLNSPQPSGEQTGQTPQEEVMSGTTLEDVKTFLEEFVEQAQKEGWWLAGKGARRLLEEIEQQIALADKSPRLQKVLRYANEHPNEMVDWENPQGGQIDRVVILSMAYQTHMTLVRVNDPIERLRSWAGPNFIILPGEEHNVEQALLDDS